MKAQESPQINKPRLVRLPEVIRRTGLSRTTIWRKEKYKEFPLRKKISSNIVGWLESEIDQWICERIMT